MSVIPAGTEITYTVTYLEMTERPEGAMPDLPSDLRLETAINPPNWFFLSLYGAVGRAYEWVDKFDEDPDELCAFIQHSDVQITTAIRNGWPQGFFMLDWRQPGVCDLAYFGLAPEAVGGGIGKAFLQTAVMTGWSRSGTTRMTVNTCTLDHPRALGLYQKIGFKPVLSEDHTRILTRDRDSSKFPS